MLWVELPRHVDALAVHERALAAGIAVEPGHLFGPDHTHASCVRLSYAHPWDDRIRRAVERVGRIAWGLAAPTSGGAPAA